MKKPEILLIIPPFRDIIYKDSKVKEAVPASPSLGMASLAAAVLASGGEARILDLNLYDDYEVVLRQTLRDFSPEFAGITFVTPLFGVMRSIAESIKRDFPDIKLIAGGAHASALPEETLASTDLDIIVIGEGDFTLPEIMLGKDLSEIKGIAYKKGDRIFVNDRRPPILDLDALPRPAWELYDVNRYRISDVMARKSPTGWLETSRGCPFNCCFCNHGVFGRNFRPKSPARVVDEIRLMLERGFREIHIVDDMFSTDVDRVKAICRGIINGGLKFPWATVTGIRVDRGDPEMFALMVKAGCYRVYFGIETGSQAILNNIGKGITLEQVRAAVAMAADAGLETCGFFMLALPGETEQTMKETIDFACSLGLDWAKVSVTTPLPSTPLFESLDREGRILTKDWNKYNLYLPMNAIYRHPNLDWDTVNRYFNAFYRRFYFRPRYMARRLFKSLSGGTLLRDIGRVFKIKW